MKPRDIVYFEDKKFGRHRFWQIVGVHFGAQGYESLVEVRSLTEKPGYSYEDSEHPTTFVPEPMLRNLVVYTPDISRE